MSYGKDPEGLNDIPTFRQSAKMQQNNRQRSSGGGGGSPYFVGAFKPSLDDTDRVRLLKGSYKVPQAEKSGNLGADGKDEIILVEKTLYYYPWTEHFHATFKRGAICSAGPYSMYRDRRQPCRGCEQFWEDKNAGKKNGPMSKTDKFAFSMLHYAPYAKMEQVDRKTGVVRVNSENKPYYEWRRIYPHERQNYVGREMRDVNDMHWSLPFSHWNTLCEYDKEIGKSCRSCGGRDTMTMEAWVCRKCGLDIIGQDTPISAGDLENLTGSPVRCSGCNHVGYLKEWASCNSCANGERAEIFDVDINVKRKQANENSNQTQLIVTSWSNPSPIDARYAEFAKPMDLVKKFAPTPYDQQTEMFGGGSVVSGRQPVTGQHSRAYGSVPTVGPGGKIVG